MRIASIYLPSFPLQAALASAAVPPSRATPIAVIASHGAPVVVACSRAAHAQGVRPGMVASVARGHAPELICLVRDAAGEAELVRALADALLGLTPSVDLGGEPRGQYAQPRDLPRNHALFVEVPAGKRGAAFGARVIELAAGLGLRVRVGIADDRYTAAVAAAHGSDPTASGVGRVAAGGAATAMPAAVMPAAVMPAVGVPGGAAVGAVTVVPRGGSAAFLAPLPLALLALPAEVQHVLESLGVRTLGAFAELPPPSVARAWDADLQALARGDGGTRFDTYVPVPRLRERIAVGASGASGAGGATGLGAAIQRLAARLAARLTGRGSARAVVELRLGGAAGGPSIELVGPYDADAIGDELARAIGDAHPAWSEPGVLSIELAVALDTDDEAAAPLDAATAARPAAVDADELADVLPLVLTPVPSILGHRPEHRRTRRGKQRPRIAPGQARLFARDS